MSAADIVHTQRGHGAFACSHRLHAARMQSVKVTWSQHHVVTECQSAVHCSRQHVSRTHTERRRSHPVKTFRNRMSSAQCQSPIYMILFPQAQTRCHFMFWDSMMQVAKELKNEMQRSTPAKIFLHLICRRLLATEK
jgi:hypothetical protein